MIAIVDWGSVARKIAIDLRHCHYITERPARQAGENPAPSDSECERPDRFYVDKDARNDPSSIILKVSTLFQTQNLSGQSPNLDLRIQPRRQTILAQCSIAMGALV